MAANDISPIAPNTAGVELYVSESANAVVDAAPGTGWHKLAAWTDFTIAGSEAPVNTADTSDGVFAQQGNLQGVEIPINAVLLPASPAHGILVERQRCKLPAYFYARAFASSLQTFSGNGNQVALATNGTLTFDQPPTQAFNVLGVGATFRNNNIDYVIETYGFTGTNNALVATAARVDGQTIASTIAATDVEFLTPGIEYPPFSALVRNPGGLSVSQNQPGNTTITLFALPQHLTQRRVINTKAS